MMNAGTSWGPQLGGAPSDVFPGTPEPRPRAAGPEYCAEQLRTSLRSCVTLGRHRLFLVSDVLFVK